MSGIYLIRNTSNGMVYIGSTTRDIEQRWKEHKQNLNHCSHSNYRLQMDWNKYGQDCFSFEVIHDGDFGRTMETDLILEHINNCYNTGFPTTLQYRQDRQVT